MHTAPVRRSLGRGLTNQGRNDDPQGPVAERDVEREGDSLVRSLSYLFSWRGMLSYLPYRTLSTLLPEADKITGHLIERHDAFWLMQQVEHHRHSRVPRRASMTCTCPATPPPRATASSDYDAPSCYLLPGTSYLLPPTNRLLHHSTLACPPMTVRERTVRKLPYLHLYLTC